ncbi:dihydroorotase [Bacteroidales bacterium AH-315-N07]|nr:dihydroorotase [Bacteroidales bacterium AH-315-N07]
MKSCLIKNSKIVNEGKTFYGSVFIDDGKISKVIASEDKETESQNENASQIIDGKGKYLFPGIIDDQVHFREPGLTHKAEIYTEAKAAVAGGVTSYMEMPNTIPNAITQELLEKKYQIASERSLANYSFFMGTSNDNLEEVLKTDPKQICGVKIFMGSSTGNMLVDNRTTLENIFSNTSSLIALHCEDENTILNNLKRHREKYGDNIPMACHPKIRNEEACYKSSSLAIELAKKHNTRLHVLHITTEKELDLFDNHLALEEKQITNEVCVHHLWFDSNDYAKLGSQIKCNPAIKESKNKIALFEGLLSNKLDIIATDHAPHTWEEKQNNYINTPSGIPLVQHSLNIMLEFYHQGKISLEKIAEKMCHAPADCFRIEKRGYIREGYWADLVLVDLDNSWQVNDENILYKCGWSPFKKYTFKSKITHTFVNGHLVFENGNFDENQKGKRLTFRR